MNSMQIVLSVACDDWRNVLSTSDEREATPFHSDFSSGNTSRLLDQRRNHNSAALFISTWALGFSPRGNGCFRGVLVEVL